MANPATELYNLLSAWQYLPQGTSVLSDRLAEGESDWWPDHARAVRLFDAVRAEVDRRSDAVGGRLRIATSGTLERIARGIFATDMQMNTTFGQPRDLFDEADLVALELFGESWPERAAIHPTVSEGLLAFARDARALVLDESSQLDQESRSYLLTLIDALERAVASTRDDDEHDVRRLACELVGALSALLAENDDSGSATAKELVKRGLTWVRLTIIDKGTAAYFTALGAGYAAGQQALPPGK